MILVMEYAPTKHASALSAKTDPHFLYPVSILRHRSTQEVTHPPKPSAAPLLANLAVCGADLERTTVNASGCFSWLAMLGCWVARVDSMTWWVLREIVG